MEFKLGTKINLIVIAIIMLLSTIVGFVVHQQMTKGIEEFATEKARADLTFAYRYIDTLYPGDWTIESNQLYKGSILMNDNYGVVDTIGDDTGDTVTIFLGDTRISTNVIVDGQRAVNTKVSPEVAHVVLNEGNNYYGKAEVAGYMYQTAYMPIKESTGEVIGISYVGASQEIIDQTIASFLKIFLSVLFIVIVISMLIVYLFTRALKRRLTIISNALASAGNGDFTIAVDDQSSDELGELSTSYNTMREKLNTMINQVKDSSYQVAASSEQLHAGSEQASKATEQITDAIQVVADGAENQTVNVNESSIALDELAVGINQMAENALVISDASSNTSKKAERGGNYVEKTVQQIHAIHTSVDTSGQAIKLLEKRSEQIGDISNVINKLAAQTNLLALNASIEASRAGDHGKGFAVVATEVGKLAEQSQRSSTQISNLIDEIRSEIVHSNHSIEQVKQDVQTGLSIVEHTDTSFKEIVQAMREMGGQIDNMVSTAEQLSAYSEEVSAAINGIKSVSKETSAQTQNVVASTEEQLASMEEIAASANSLATMANTLQELVSKFRV
ncbi:methyl-accepting chemotaxis protein [Bacillus sp. FJAT-45350]|uniref:methyl-accepting chemotaxis protein n=1 Tax=Bacillus sp. FJAT-45350 TaxID=2011014 RepID=UPI000BB7A8E9|nr:methyl-accepting chemotaxis protein [Bacillus sp. FJAT-45350]